MNAMLTVTPFINDHFDSCAYVLDRPGCARSLVIDPGDDATGRIEAFLDERGLTPAAILLTHEHFDHISGVNRLKARFPEAPLVCSRACSEFIVDPKKNFSRYLIGIDLACGPADLLCEDLGLAFDWSGEHVAFIPTPGHSPGSVCIAAGGALFTGDTLLLNLKTVTKLPGGSRRDLAESIDLLLARFPGETTVYPGHGEPFQLHEVEREVILGKGTRS